MMNFKNNLLYGLGLSLLLLFISSMASFISIKNLIDSASMVKNSNRIIQDLDHVFSLVKDAETGQRGYLLSGDERFLEPYNNAKEKISEGINALSAEVTNTNRQTKNLEKLESSIITRVDILDRNLNHKKENKEVTPEQLLSGKKYMDEIRSIVTVMQKEEQAILKSRTEIMDKFASYTPWLIIVSAILAITITLVFYRKVLQDFNEKTKLTQELEKKNDETENRLIAIEKVAAQISRGDYNILWDQNAQETLGSVAGPLNRMAESLQSSFNTLAEKEWLSSTIAHLNDRMMGNKSMEKLASSILEEVTANTQSHVAAVYLQGEDNQLHLTGSYALADATARKLKIGEGIAGEAFRSEKQIIVKDIPDDAITISFATGSTKPKNIVALPITRHNLPLGVIELGSMHDYSARELEFLRSVAGNIGLAFYSAQSRIKLQELLEETQAQSEELQTQHSELENINAELEAQSQKLLASEEELRVQQEELMQSNQELEERTGLLEEKNALIEQRNTDIQQKSIELEQSTKYKSEFLANMSHELRTPLNSILLLSKLMTESDDLDEQYVEYAEVMQSSGQGLLILIDEILDLSKIESGKMTLEINEVPLAEITADMQMLFKPMAKEKNLALNIETDEEAAKILHTDKLRLEQILKNLLSNAIKFTSEGSITLHVSSDEKKEKVYFKVTDTGIGIPKDKIRMVFEAFQQADGSTQRKYGGTGLGLSISRELARLLGGEIQLQSTEGQGSEFTLVVPTDYQEGVALPAQKQEEATPYLVQEAEKLPERFVTDRIPQQIEDDRDDIQQGDKVILIIEDDTAFAKILLDFSRTKNYKAIVAVRGDAGIEMAQHFKPLAILLDIQLPIMDGWQVMEALKSNPETKPIPVHIMSSMKFKQESLLRGAVDFINKPFALEQMQEIFSKLENALNRSPKKVLIVEENEQHAKALSYFLSANNITTDIANNVSDSIESLHNREIDCVILDMGVPDRNAYETLETIKQNKGLEQLPIIVFTGKNLSKGEENRIKKYADSIVVKTAYSYQRILDEAGLFLHLVEEKNKQKHERMSGFGNEGELRNILKDKTVLIADDDVRNIFSLTKALEIHGMKVLPAMDGKEALKVLEKEPGIDVVLMDMMMPEMDGYETIREIRSSAQFRNLPVLAVTSKAMMGDREKCIAVGASDYISKPVDIDQLVSLLRVWLYDKI
ncbi:response regulator [Chryseobacterium sp. MDT2-18]|uniref:response regulator n=1 Tax=Chryseobacterium sp. MDT2-18 TaxID=1259136 RepID=UPI00277E15A9|nr:response regulator [Chryseobacterium sp. MDT2-18]MDQ0477976.1 signal transduction histidine kinase/CheY-like chemotaxis protein/CHASE3 domain sensor protein [Chryseobacterium sp. MDT2-18]